MRPPAFPPGHGYGACLPRSGDLAAELPALAEVFDTRRGRVRHVAVGRSTWPTAPCDLTVTGHTVRASWFASGLDPYTIRIFSYGLGRWDPPVVPPGTEPTAAG
ncbi:DUF5994 family protein [Streptomyces sp. NPDC050625]|uniref:DUF5994 family protein n=1 Tax=Streptomyces sp. NPDC050625 TaxID=3154629 RepID=UPI00343E0DDB